MTGYDDVAKDPEFARLSLSTAQYPKTLAHWTALVEYLLKQATPISRSIDKKILTLLRSTYGSLLNQFPYLENYHVERALLEYKLGHIKTMHKLFDESLHVFHGRSLLIWIEYLKVCNEIISDSKKLFKLYARAEDHIGLHFYSTEFWDMYLDQIKLRCTSRKKEWYCRILRKMLEIPTQSIGKTYALWLTAIDEIRDLKELKYFIKESDITTKWKVDLRSQGRRGPRLMEAKILLRKMSKELYLVIQFQVLEIYNLFESQLITQFYDSSESLISTHEIVHWEKYLDYLIKLQNKSLVHLTFERAIIVLAHYDHIWIKYARWLITHENDYASAKNICLEGLKSATSKTRLLNLLYSITAKMHEFEVLQNQLSQVQHSFPDGIEHAEDFAIFEDYLRFQIFLQNIAGNTTESQDLLQRPHILECIQKRLALRDLKQGQELIITMMLQLQTKHNTSVIESKIFHYILKHAWKYYMGMPHFWYSYCQLIYSDHQRTYLQKRQSILKDIINRIPDDYKRHVLPRIRDEFYVHYIPEDLDEIDAMLK